MDGIGGDEVMIEGINEKRRDGRKKPERDERDERENRNRAGETRTSKLSKEEEIGVQSRTRIDAEQKPIDEERERRKLFRPSTSDAKSM